VLPEAAFSLLLPGGANGFLLENEVKTYAEKLRDPRWQKKRLEIMQIARFECQSCGDETKTLNVHHKFYKKGAQPWDYNDEDLACLCEDCHKHEHDLKALLDKLIAHETVCHETLIGFICGHLDYPLEKLMKNYYDTPACGYEMMEGYLKGKYKIDPKNIDEFIHKRVICK